MTEKRFIPIFDGTDKRVVGAKDNGKIISFMDMFDLLNDLSDENEQLRKENDMLSCELSVSANKEISKNCRIAELEEENEQLKQQLKSIEDIFKFSCTENHFEFNKDEIKVEDTHTEITLKDGKLCISVFIPQLNEYVKFFYLVTGRKMEREFINYEGDVE